MNKRIHFGKNTPLSFRENLQFDAECPYSIRYKDFLNEDIAPLHYAQTLEIGICRGLTGALVAGNDRLLIENDAVYVVPPGTVHATTIHRGPGHVYVMHISLEALGETVNVEALLEQSGKTFFGMPYLCPGFDRFHSLVLEMVRRDSEPIARTRLLLEMFEMLAARMPSRMAADAEQAACRDRDLRHILRWTETHFTGRVRLEQAAAEVGFTKNYFCAWFKANTGLTYMRYLNHVRVSNACRVLAQTGSIASACYDSGFRDMSYFIQVFKRTQGCTPKEYLRNAH